jgi:hypothetical protein
MVLLLLPTLPPISCCYPCFQSMHRLSLQDQLIPPFYQQQIVLPPLLLLPLKLRQLLLTSCSTGRSVGTPWRPSAA